MTFEETNKVVTQRRYRCRQLRESTTLECAVDGAKVTSDAASLAKVVVTAEVLEDLRGPKIVIHKFKNKTGYHKRQGFRADLTRVKVTSIK